MTLFLAIIVKIQITNFRILTKLKLEHKLVIHVYVLKVITHHPVRATFIHAKPKKFRLQLSLLEQLNRSKSETLIIYKPHWVLLYTSSKQNVIQLRGQV